jgi:hypothetical protein
LLIVPGLLAVEVYQVNHRHRLKDEQQGQPVMVWELVPVLPVADPAGTDCRSL